MNQRFTAIIEREDDDYVALCPELDIASQGESVAEARNNLRRKLSNCSWKPPDGRNPEMQTWSPPFEGVACTDTKS